MATQQSLGAPGGDGVDAVLLDQGVLDELHMLDPDGALGLLNEVIGSYLSESPRSMAELRQGWQAPDHQQISRAAHTLKGSSGTIGALKMSAWCALVEVWARADGEPAVPDLAEGEQIFAGTMEALRLAQQRLVPSR